ncbi:DUF5009 domain-containing protein [Undibacterium cyanobacteriorum]|uniref:DUF5009 domain-containing protein n=1 Tax=Undibacterium cyanobacteriorum TaxID=3073561 RepID=A0ABY9RE20_9BURK|nr:heparan-alpha-glucosaminide N-acetyltransferase domain-containing protein [Undibacterium sp. 20NA77.5]WMW79475.1 DUF5009 domain-containing protein [Undibacterium sp. 20NA77.5]
MTSQRFDSIDVFRGLTVAAMLLVNNAGDWSYVYPWLEHASWHGCTPADFIFPFFLVIVGVSLDFAYFPKMMEGTSSSSLIAAAWRRAFRIFILGIVLHVIAMYFIPDRQFRLMGVLQRIGICFGMAATLVVLLRSTVRIVVVAGMILIFYCALMSVSGGYEPHHNLADRLDTWVLGSLAYQFDPLSLRAQEPEGLLSTIPSIASVMLGVFAARLLRSRNWRGLVLAAIILAVLGFVWQMVMPWNKQLWTSSFVCWTSAWAFLFIAIFYGLIDYWKLPPVGVSFGRNAVLAYALAWIASCVLALTNAMSHFYPTWFAEGIGAYTSLEFASFAFAACFTGLIGLLMLVLRMCKVFVRL